MMEKERTKSRKAHKKSRNGCLPCKARHIKCDETKPSCVSCHKYGQTCAYPARKTPVNSPNQSISTPASIESSHPSSQIQNTKEDFSQELCLNIDHLRLLHHFTTVTSKTLTAEPGGEEVYQTYFINKAFEFPFLLQSVLALAALHLSRLENSLREDYLHQAQRHHLAALSQFRNDMTDIDASNFEAVLCFASTLDPYSVALPVDTEDSPEHILDAMLQNFALTRRVRPMVSQFYSLLLGSMLYRIVPMDARDINMEYASGPSETELTTLRRFSEVTQQIYPPDINEAYGKAIETLEIVFDVAKRSPIPPSDSVVKLWIYFATPRFMELLSERQPGALVIFAHYAVLFKRSRPYWFFDGVAEQILWIANTFVPTEWKSWLDWPKEQVNAGHIYQTDT